MRNLQERQRVRGNVTQRLDYFTSLQYGRAQLLVQFLDASCLPHDMLAV